MLIEFGYSKLKIKYRTKTKSIISNFDKSNIEQPTNIGCISSISLLCKHNNK